MPRGTGTAERTHRASGRGSDVPTAAIMRLAETGGGFDFWKEEGEDLYLEEDGEPV